ncbi:hypothetical protein L9F63_023124, partial [Diploptera punctata]
MGNAPVKGIQHHKNRGHKKYVHWDQAVPPWPPGKPHLAPGSPDSKPNVVTIRWDPPPDDGGAPITGYVVEHRKTGTPNWVRSTKDLVLEPELQLSGLEPGWRYQFRITAENAADLLSDPGELSQPLIVARAYKPATMSPQFSLELRDIVALENDKVEFVVHFHGIPTPKISWYKDSFEIFSSRRMRVTTENGTSSLLIFQAAFNDEGQYKCAATNRAGHVITKSKLRLEAPPRIRIPRQYEDGLLFEKDEVIRLKVSVAGRPLPRVTWYHDNDPIPFGGRFEVTNTERFSALRISEARRSDRGEYQVRATSRLGEDIVAFLVTVTDRPMPPGRAKVVSVTGRSVALSWSEPHDDGGCKIGNYIIEYYRLGWNVWLKAATSRQMTVTLGDLIQGSEYKFRMKAENPYGVSDPSEESEVVFIPDPKRGLLERPVRGTRSQSDIPVPIQEKLPEKKSGRSKDSLMTAREVLDLKRKEIESKRRSQEKEEVKMKKMKSDELRRNEELRKIEERRAETLLGKMEVPKRKTKETEKRSVEFLPEDTPEIVKRKKKLNSEKLEIEDSPKLPSRESDKGMKASLQFSVSKRRDSSGERDSGVSEGSFTTGSKQSFTSHLVPREDDSLLHGSSELMLVLLPQTREQQSEKETRRDSELAMFGESSVPPPISLSAPEIGGGENLITSPLRNAVSSTELLHEQAMARFYQAVAEEEAEKARERKDRMERKLSGTPEVKRRSLEAEDVEIKNTSGNSYNKTLIPPTQELTWHQRKPNIFQEKKFNNEGVTSVKRESPKPEINLKSIITKAEPAKLSKIVPRSILRNRLEGKPDYPRYYEEKKPTELEKIKMKYEVEDEEEEELVDEEEEEELEEEEDVVNEEEFLGNEELEGEESIDEDNSEFEEEEELYKKIEEEEEKLQPSDAPSNRYGRFAEEEEEETYHPRNMVPSSPTGPAPIVRTLERQLTPRPSNDVQFHPKSILKTTNMTFQQQLEEMIERPRGYVTRELERSPPKSFRDNVPKQLMQQFSSDTGSRSPSPDTLSPSPPPESPSPLPLSPSPPISPSPPRESPSPEPELFISPPLKQPEPRFPPVMSPEPEFFMAEEGQEEEEDDNFVDTIESSQNETISTEPEVSVPQVPPIEARVPPPEPVPTPEPILTPEPVPTPEPPVPPKPSASPVRDPTITPSEAARQKKMLIRKMSLEEDAEEKRAMADHYGEIIRECSLPKRVSKRYTTIDNSNVQKIKNARSEIFASQLSKKFPEVARRFSPERTIETPKPELPPPRPITPKKEPSHDQTQE